MLDPKKIRLIIVIAVISLVGGVIFYLGTHGRVVVKNPGDKTLSIIRLHGNGTYAEPVDIGNGSIITSGNYVVKNGVNGLSRLAHVSVPGWLMSAEISFAPNPSAKTTRLAALTYERFFTADNGSLTSYSDINGYLTGYTTHPADDAFAGSYTDTSFPEDISTPTITRDGQLLGISTHEDALLKYSFKTGAFTDIAGVGIKLPGRVEAEADLTLLPKIQRSSDVNSGLVGIYEKKQNAIKTLDASGKASVFLSKINNSRSIVFDANDTAWAVVETPPASSVAGDVEDEDVDLTYSITVHNTVDNVVKTVPIGSAKVVSGVAVSPSGKFVAALKDGELWVYQVDNQQAVLVDLFATTTRLFWDKSKLYALSTDAGINVFNTDTLQLLPVSLDTGNNLSFSDGMMFGSKLYFTAYNSKQDSKLPDGYVIDLDQKSDGIHEELAKKLPYKESLFEMSYLANTIYIRVNYFDDSGDQTTYAKRVEEIKARANAKLSGLINPDILKRCKVVFVT